MQTKKNLNLADGLMQKWVNHLTKFPLPSKNIKIGPSGQPIQETGRFALYTDSQIIWESWHSFYKFYLSTIW